MRYGGEEFCVLLPDVAIERAHGLSEQIRLAVYATVFATRTGKANLQISVSAGVAAIGKKDILSESKLTRKQRAEAEKSEAEAVAKLVASADEMLYVAKAGGRNCVKVAYGKGAFDNTTTGFLPGDTRARVSA